MVSFLIYIDSSQGVSGYFPASHVAIVSQQTPSPMTASAVSPVTSIQHQQQQQQPQPAQPQHNDQPEDTNALELCCQHWIATYGKNGCCVFVSFVVCLIIGSNHFFRFSCFALLCCSLILVFFSFVVVSMFAAAFSSESNAVEPLSYVFLAMACVLFVLSICVCCKCMLFAPEHPEPQVRFCFCMCVSSSL